MSALTAAASVARRKSGQSSSPSPSPLSVKLPSDVVESARIVAALRGVSMSDLLGEILRPVLAKMEKDELARRSKRIDN